MTVYGDNQEPGIITDLTSSASVPTSGEAPSDAGFVGQADLANATNPADTSKVYQITRASKAVEYFGPQESSLLTNVVIDALAEGAFPVFAAVAPSTEVTGETHDSASSTTVDFDNAPIREDPDSITVTLDGSDQTVNVVRDDVSSYSPNTGECYVNPVRGKVEVASIPSTSLSFDYEHFDYGGGIDVMVNNAGEEIDFLVPVTENTDFVDDVNTTVATMEGEYNLAIAVGGADIYLDPNSFENQYDDSRTQVVYPTRFEDGTSALGAYVGLRASLGLATTPINKRFTTNKRLDVTLSRAERGSLIDENVVPLADEAQGARIVDDPTTVTDGNSAEENLQYGFNRLAADYIINTARENEQPFIGKLNSPTVRNTLEGMISEQLTQLQTSGVVLSYEVNVLKEDATTAGLEMKVDLAEPLRFIKNTVTIGNGG